MKKLSYFFLFLFSGQLMAQSSNLCLTNRGNGFKIFSHFGALSRIIEDRGIPDAITGNSSASVSAFLVSSMRINPMAMNSDFSTPNKNMSLMLKSIPYALEILANDMKVEEIAELAQSEEAKKDFEKLKELKDFNFVLLPVEIVKFLITYAGNKNIREMINILQGPYVKEIIDPEFLTYAQKTKEMELKLSQMEKESEEKAKLSSQVAFRQNTMKTILASFQGFDIENNYNVYFQPGLVNQKGVAKIWDRLASFYAGYNIDQNSKDKFKAWLSDCSESTYGLNLSELEKRKPRCVKKFQKLYKAYLNDYNKYDARLPKCSQTNQRNCIKTRYLEPVGSSGMSIFIVSSAIVGESRKSFLEMKDAYKSTSDFEFGKNFSAHPDDFRLAVWARPDDAQRIENKLNGGPFLDKNDRIMSFSEDFRAKRLYFMGDQTWQNALYASTSEPGQTATIDWQELSGQKVLSTGGWEGLQLTEVLKGIDCKETIAITTQVNHGNYFFENAMKHLFHDNLSGLMDKTKAQLTLGDSSDQDSDWSKWKNWENPQSQMNRSLDAADGVYCTNWDARDPFSADASLEENLKEIFRDGYDAPIYINESLDANHSLWDTNLKQIQSWQNTWSDDLDRNRYHGCIPYR